jgi:hypothetical protein
MKLTGRTYVPSKSGPPVDWEPLEWLRSWDYDPGRQEMSLVDEPVRNPDFINESIFLASTLNGFML